MNNPKYIIVHHTGGTDANPHADTSHHTFGVVDGWHKKLWNFPSSLGHYIGYHYFIDSRGKVTQGRAHNEVGAHCIGYNDKSIGVCLAGNFDVSLPTREQEEALRMLLVRLMSEEHIHIENIVPHRTFAKKTCYGSLLMDDWAQELVSYEVPRYSVAKLGDKDTENVTNLQQFLREHGYEHSDAPMTDGVYDENMARAVLWFQVGRNVADTQELAWLRGERIGEKTLQIIYQIV